MDVERLCWTCGGRPADEESVEDDEESYWDRKWAIDMMEFVQDLSFANVFQCCLNASIES